MRVAVLGGGIAGLASAYRLAKTGVEVRLFEAQERLGGLARSFTYEGFELDCFYHTILDSDSYLLPLIEELGLKDRLRWTKTSMGLYARGRLYPFDTPVDLLRFRALPFIDRLRVGFGALYITKVKRNGAPLDDVLAHEWLRRVFGRRVYDAIWDPMLDAKFGDLRHRVPAYWVWNTLNREKDGSEEVKTYLPGGMATIADGLRDAIEAHGGTVLTSTAVGGIEARPTGVTLRVADEDQEYDAAVSTLPLPLLNRIWAPGSTGTVPLSDLAYQGVVNVVLICRHQLEKFYWTAVVDDEFPFQGVVETTHIIDPEWIGGRHLVYLMNYCSSDSDKYRLDDDTVKRQAVDGLARLYPGFDREDVEAVFVYRAPHVEPVWPTGYLGKRPDSNIAGTRVYLATTAQAYPMVTSWNTSVSLADACVDGLLGDAGDGVRRP